MRMFNKSKKHIIVLCLTTFLLTSFTNNISKNETLTKIDLNEVALQENNIDYSKSDSKFIVTANNTETQFIGDTSHPDEIVINSLNNEYQSFVSSFKYDLDNNIINAVTPNMTYTVNKSDSKTKYLINSVEALTIIQDNNIQEIIYPNGDYQKNENIDDNTIKVTFSNKDEFTILKDINNNIINDGLYSYTYDEENKLTSCSNDDFVYYETNELLKYGSTSNPLSINFHNSDYVINNNSLSFSYEDNKQISQVNLNDKVFHSYSYNINQSNQIQSEDIYGDTYTYQYDNYGNVISIINNQNKTNYTYDSFDRLKSVIVDNYSYLYDYDVRGNLINEQVNGINNSYTYNDDQLLEVNGLTLSYDINGNLIQYNHNKYNYTRGRLLSYWTNLNDYCSYYYDSNSIRTEKKRSSETIKYFYQDNKLLTESSSLYGDTSYIYDSEDNVIGFVYLNQLYLYKRDFLKTILGIIDTNGNEVVKYEYDPYGKLLNITDTSTNNISLHNNILYKGYYYDRESKLYYILNRYYSPELKRFITRDKIDFRLSTQSNDSIINLYSYAEANPIMKMDEDGLLALPAMFMIYLTCIVFINVLLVITINYLYKALYNMFSNSHNLTATGILENEKDKYKDFFKAIIKSIATGMSKIKDYVKSFANKYGDKKEKHHIIAKSSLKHATLRYNYTNILLRDVNYEENLVDIKKSMHKHLHTNAYYASTNAILLPCSTNYNYLGKFLNELETIYRSLEAISNSIK